MQQSCKGQHKVKAGGELRSQANQKAQLWSWYHHHKADLRIVIVVSEFTTGISHLDSALLLEGMCVLIQRWVLQ